MREAIIFLIVVGVAVFFLATHFMNKFNAKKAKIKVADKKLQQALQDRLSFTEQLDRSMPQDSSIGKSGVAAALRASKKSTLSDNIHELGLLMAEASTHLERVSMQMRNPNIAQPNQSVLTLLDQMDGVNRKLKIAKRERNDEVREYNQMVNAGASAIVASLMKFEEMDLLVGPNDRPAD